MKEKRRLKLNFRAMLFAAILVAVIVPASLMVGVLYFRARNEITGNISRIVVSTLNFVRDTIEFSLDSIALATDTMLSDPVIQKTAAWKGPMSREDIIRTNIACREVMLSYTKSFRALHSSIEFDSFYIYLPAQRLLMDSKTTYYENVNPANIDFIHLKEPGGARRPTREVDYWTLNDKERYFGESNKLLTYTTAIIDDDGTVLLRLAANVSAEFLADYYGRVQKGIPGTFLIQDSNGTILAESTDSDPSATLRAGLPGAGPFFEVSTSSPETGWKYILQIPDNEVYGSLENLQRFFMFAVAFIILLMIPAALILAKPLAKPYERLEVNLLQEQINPHFLYNTLDSLYSMAALGSLDAVKQMTASLSKFFRVSLSGGKNDVLLRDSLDIVKSYISIQNLRFGNKIAFTVDIPDELLEITAPKLLLQPLVENSVVHGIEPSDGVRSLSISCKRSDKDNLSIFVKDNGVGIERGKLASLKAALAKNTREYYGLTTMNQMLKMKYGGAYGLDIESEEGAGCTVAVKIPIKYE
jgi:two-component system sensor histidine kinase YesM